VVEAPDLVHVPVEGVVVGVERLHALHVLLGDQRPAARVDDRLVQALLVHDAQPGLAVLVRLVHRLELVRLLGIARGHRLEHLLERTGTVDLPELRFQAYDDAVPGEDHLAPVRQGHRGDRRSEELLREVAGEGVPLLVHVLVAVEDALAQFGHGVASGPQELFSTPSIII
jgi:hypothetical protein